MILEVLMIIAVLLLMTAAIVITAYFDHTIHVLTKKEAWFMFKVIAVIIIVTIPIAALMANLFVYLFMR